MKKTTEIERDPQEIVDVYEYNVSMLQHLCDEFDNGRTEAALWIAVVLRTLLHTHSDHKGKRTSFAIIDQLKEIDKKYDFDFLSTCFGCPSSTSFAQGWQLGDGVCGVNVLAASVYAGLIIKTINRVEGGVGYVVDAVIKGTEFKHTHHWLLLNEWMNEEVFRDNESGEKLSRWDVISMIANKDGGAHFDPKVPIKYDTFRRPDLFTVSFGETIIPFSKNPVYVSVRQIAWEVLESLGEISNMC